VVPRRLLLWAVLGLVLVVGSALGRPSTARAAEAGERFPAAATHPVASASTSGETGPADSGSTAGVTTPADAGTTGRADSAVAHGEHDVQPCVLRSDCAGAWVFGAGGLLLAVAVAMPAIGAVTTVGRVGRFPQVPSSRLVASRLFRPPQLS
jgi:hypothetical protein